MDVMTDLTKLIKTKERSTGNNRPLNILFASTEVAPFSKTGGLGDVAAALPKALAARGHRVSVFTPLYHGLDPVENRFSRRLLPLEIPTKAKTQKKVEANIWETRMAHGAKIFFLDYPEFFDREGIYGYDGGAFDDNAARFAFFARAAVEFTRQTSVPVDILHLNDWHTALAPVYIDQYYKEELAEVKTFLSIHNIAYQGEFDESELDATGLPKSFGSDTRLGHNGKINFLKGGLLDADALATVSPTHADEIKTEEGGHGLDHILSDRADDLTGIINGVDYNIWSPENDQYIDVRYSAERLNGKRQNKAHLQHGFGLPVRPVLPLLAFVGRLAEQKGIDLLVPALRKELKEVEGEQDGFQVVFLGEGDPKLQKQIEKLQSEFPRRVAAHFGYSEERAHKMIAGSDLLLVPSRFEPCGLTQIYALRYGTLPIVHATGGLADTVKDADQHENGTGFVFENFTKGELGKAIRRAVERYRHHRQWRPLIVNAMKQDFGWDKSAELYENTYYAALGLKSEEREKSAS